MKNWNSLLILNIPPKSNQNLSESFLLIKHWLIDSIINLKRNFGGEVYFPISKIQVYLN